MTEAVRTSASPTTATDRDTASSSVARADLRSPEAFNTDPRWPITEATNIRSLAADSSPGLLPPVSGGESISGGYCARTSRYISALSSKRFSRRRHRARLVDATSTFL